MLEIINLLMELNNCLRGRRSIRKFREKTVEKEKLYEILEAARWAPSGGNDQPWRFIVISNAVKIEKMKRAVRESLHSKKKNRPNLVRNLRFGTFFNAPVIISVCVNLKSAMPLIGNKNVSVTNKLIDNVEIIGTGAAIQNMLLKAHDLGLGACWCRIDYYKRQKLEDCLGIKKPYALLANIVLGYPAETPKSERKPLSKIIEFIK